MRKDHGAAEAAVAHEEVRPQADEEQRLLLGQRPQKLGEGLNARWREESLGRAAGAPAQVSRDRLAEVEGVGHVHASCAATLPIEPAPIVTTTSPSCARRRIASGISPMSSTNTGSTPPATRSARASARPSAATIGASPAGYTSARSSASAVDSTLTKSSKRSRVRV